MADPKTTYVVSIFDTVAKVWRNLLTTTDRTKAEALLKRIETFTPRLSKR